MKAWLLPGQEQALEQVELARLGGVYRGFSRGRVDAEHSLVGHYSLTGRHGSGNGKPKSPSASCFKGYCDQRCDMLHLPPSDFILLLACTDGF